MNNRITMSADAQVETGAHAGLYVSVTARWELSSASSLLTVGEAEALLASRDDMHYTASWVLADLLVVRRREEADAFEQQLRDALDEARSIPAA